MQNDFRGEYPSKTFVEFCRLVSDWDFLLLREDALQNKRQRPDFGTSWRNIKTMIVVVITNKVFGVDPRAQIPMMEPEVINTYEMRHVKHPTRTLCSVDARVVIVSLGNFHKSEAELSTLQDKWLFTLKDSSLESGSGKIPIMKHIDDLAHVVDDSDPGLGEFYSSLNVDSISPSDLNKHLFQLRDNNQRIEALNQEAEARGKALGQAAFLRSLLRSGFHRSTLIQSLGLSEEEFDLLLQESIEPSTLSVGGGGGGGGGSGGKTDA